MWDLRSVEEDRGRRKGNGEKCVAQFKAINYKKKYFQLTEHYRMSHLIKLEKKNPDTCQYYKNKTRLMHLKLRKHGKRGS